jgi:hypothetical protein
MDPSLLGAFKGTVYNGAIGAHKVLNNTRQKFSSAKLS